MSPTHNAAPPITTMSETTRQVLLNWIDCAAGEIKQAYEAVTEPKYFRRNFFKDKAPHLVKLIGELNPVAQDAGYSLHEDPQQWFEMAVYIDGGKGGVSLVPGREVIEHVLAAAKAVVAEAETRKKEGELLRQEREARAARKGLRAGPGA